MDRVDLAAAPPAAPATPSRPSPRDRIPNTHVYAATGTYTVTVMASAGGVTKSSTIAVVVAEAGPPSAGYTITGATLGDDSRFVVLLDHTVTFVSAEAHAASWAWDFGDGSTASGAAVTHTFEAVGSPNVTLTVTGDGTNTLPTTVGAAIGFDVQDPAVLYLGPNGRYEVRATWSSTGQNASGVGTGDQPDDGHGLLLVLQPLEPRGRRQGSRRLHGRRPHLGLRGRPDEPARGPDRHRHADGRDEDLHQFRGHGLRADPGHAVRDLPGGGNSQSGGNVVAKATADARASSSRRRRRRIPSWATRFRSRRRPQASPARSPTGGTSATARRRPRPARTPSGPATTPTSTRRPNTYTVTVTASSGGQSATASQSVVVSRLRRDSASLDGLHRHGRLARRGRPVRAPR